MSSEMIERVARVIDSRLRDVLEPGDLIWSRPGGPSNLALNIARAAIEAMREPTGEMNRAGCRAIPAAHGQAWICAPDAYAAMIDAAVKDPA